MTRTHEILLQYLLLADDYVTREELKSVTGKSTSRLSEYLKELSLPENGNCVFDCPPRSGKVKLISYSPDHIAISQEKIWHWLILYTLKYPMTRSELYSELLAFVYHVDLPYYENAEFVSPEGRKKIVQEAEKRLGFKPELTPVSLYNDLTELVRKGYIRLERMQNRYVYKKIPVTEKARVPVSKVNVYTQQELFQMYKKLELNGLNDAYIEQMATLKKKVLCLLDYDDHPSEKKYAVHGKARLQNYSPILAEFRALPYEQKKIRFTYRKKKIVFSVGLFHYASDKGEYYLIGEVGKETLCLRLVLIEIGSFEVLDEPNLCWQSEKFRQIDREMFSVSVEPPVKVRVEFDLYSENMKKRIDTLHRSRPDSQLEGNIYTDTIRGLNDFARYLREFGRAAKVLEPEVLRKQMLRSSELLIEAYKERGLYGKN